jgi:UDP-2,4-diacetamido-2,4,6-trideoxy-beta-L-altropyranose hydrolase
MKLTKILFRADGNADIGAGHVMRCLSIASAANKQNVECKFVISDTSFQKVIEKYGFQCIVLNSNYCDMDYEVSDLIALLKDEKPSLLVIDSYYVTESYLISLKKEILTMYIDDIKMFAYPVHFLLNYNAYASDMNYKEFYKKNGRKLPLFILGEKYAPLRKEFQNLPEVETAKEVKNIFFSSGGADSERIVLPFILKAIGSFELKDYNIHIVLSAFEPDSVEILEMAERNNRLFIHENVDNMAELMRSCDIAVSAAGSTIYELCACGIPTITYILADNQVQGAKTLSCKNIVINAGDYRTGNSFFEKLIELIGKLCLDYHKRKTMHDNAINAIDGNGANAIVGELIKHLQ